MVGQHRALCLSGSPSRSPGAFLTSNTCAHARPEERKRFSVHFVASPGAALFSVEDMGHELYNVLKTQMSKCPSPNPE